MILNRNALSEACLVVSRNIRYRRNSVDETIAKASVELYMDIALRYEAYLIDQGRDPNIITRVVNYVAHKHVIPPMEGNVESFSTALEVLMELVCPNSAVSSDQEQFFKDIEVGIEEARDSY